MQRINGWEIDGYITSGLNYVVMRDKKVKFYGDIGKGNLIKNMRNPFDTDCS